MSYGVGLGNNFKTLELNQISHLFFNRFFPSIALLTSHRLFVGCGIIIDDASGTAESEISKRLASQSVP